MCHGGQRTTFRSKFSSSTSMWVPGIELRLLVYATSAFYVLSHFAGSIQIFFKNQGFQYKSIVIVK